ncbi:endonuclease [Cloacibacterium normanense]|uniref:Por secretion system C-terminal sorting domain protein n=1 Tax=Cloacibacterium normanense TaxID=237258 RepID=A0A1E5UGP0_9FLAO|nr:endonuclease [Cloacibacterium normanense]AZI68635.1 T9SS C-terminal target domain-containing protein [Cloacibacterium normanense]OEL12060.1 por secretion system C-terminal sorting domain protein [Cloacibacterium normanense]SDO42092.1 Por secretion system C-terminal sorting domain-containing protein [Cloacibacterium normanense]
MKIKTLLIVGLLFSVANIFAQIPTGYYDGTTGLTGAALKTKLSQIITSGHQTKSYDNLYNGYPSTDSDNYYEKDGSVLDIYSENPKGTDPYVYQHGSKQCGSYKVEGDCYNREHIFPQGYFNSASPMVSDIHHIVPTDGKVNGYRSNFPFGKVGSANFISENGSKRGTSASPNYSGTVFEPIDEFKGDVARMILYFATRYESKLSSFKDNDILTNSAFPGVEAWELAVLKEWHTNDPVSEKEIDRNNAAYSFQGNRNPFIDHPEYVALIWGTTTPDTEAPSTPTNLIVTGSTSSTISLSWTASTDNIMVATYDIYLDGTLKTSSSSNSITVTGLNPSTTYSFYVKAKDAAGNTSSQSNTTTGTTTENTGGNDGGSTTSCGTEDFEGVSGAVNTYKTVTWNNNEITWTATDSRSDQTINNKAITVRNGTLSSSTISGGISSLTIKTQLKFSGTNGSFKLFINGVEKGTIPYSDTVTTTTISNINVSGNVTISIQNNSTTSNRVAFDDLSWTCYNGLGTDETTVNKFSIYPNPVKNNTLYVTGKNIEKIKRVEIYNVNGILVQVIEKPFSNKNFISLKNTTKGMYLLKFDNNSYKFLVE